MQYVYSAVFVFFFFFSSRRRHTRFDCDWSSDVCSSDLQLVGAVGAMHYFSLLTDARGTVLEVQGPLERSDIRVQARSEEHTSELQSQSNLVCRLLLEKKKTKTQKHSCRHPHTHNTESITTS